MINGRLGGGDADSRTSCVAMGGIIDQAGAVQALAFPESTRRTVGAALYGGHVVRLSICLQATAETRT